MTPTDTDHEMIHHAANRGPVVVTIGKGQRQIDAILIAWRPRRARNTARVMFQTGGQASVPVGQVSLPEVTA